MNKSSEQLAANHATAATPSGSAGRKHHVLVVDDDEAFRRVIARLLRRAGFRIAVAADGAEIGNYGRKDVQFIPVVFWEEVMGSPFAGRA